MAQGFGEAYANKILNHVMRHDDALLLQPAHLEVALFTSVPGEAGDGSEVSGIGTGYARVEMHPADWSAPASGSIDNTAVVTFPEATTAWGTVTHWALYDKTNSYYMLYGTVSTPGGVVVAAGDTPRFQIGELVFSLTQGFWPTYADLILNHIFGKTTLVPSDTITVALFSDDPEPHEGASHELVGDGYARMSTTHDVDWTSAAATSSISNTAIVLFAEDTGSDWVDVNYFGLYDVDNATFMGGGSLTGAPIDINVGDAPKFIVGAITINLD